MTLKIYEQLGFDKNSFPITITLWVYAAFKEKLYRGNVVIHA